MRLRSTAPASAPLVVFDARSLVCSTETDTGNEITLSAT